MVFVVAKLATMFMYSSPAFAYTIKSVSDTHYLNDYVGTMYRVSTDSINAYDFSYMLRYTYLSLHDGMLFDDSSWHEVPYIGIPISICKMLRAPDICVPEEFERLVAEGREEDLRKLEEICYVRAEHINLATDCFRYIIKFLKDIYTALSG